MTFKYIVALSLLGLAALWLPVSDAALAEAVFVVDGMPDARATDRKAPSDESGRYLGPLGEVDGATIDVVVASGFVVSARVTLRGGRVLMLKPSGAPNHAPMNLVARDGSDYLRLSGQFRLPGRAEGTFSGALNRKQVKGSWHILRQ